MTRASPFRCLAIILATAGACAQGTASNLAINGGFEEDLAVGWTSSSVDRTPGDNSGITYFIPYEGRYAVDLEGSGTNVSNLSGFVSQSFNTIPGQGYSLHFVMGGNYWVWTGNVNPTFETKHLEVLWNGNSLGVFDYALHPGDTITRFTWDVHELSIPGASVIGGDILMFRSINPVYGGYGAFIDDINVSSTPEPATLALLGLGLAGLGFSRRKQ